MELLIEQRSVGGNAVIQHGYGVRRRCRAVGILARAGETPSATGMPRIFRPAWRRSARPEEHWRKPDKARLELTASGIVIVKQRFRVSVGCLPGKFIHLIVIVSELRHLIDQIMNPVKFLLILRRHGSGDDLTGRLRYHLRVRTGALLPNSRATLPAICASTNGSSVFPKLNIRAFL